MYLDAAWTVRPRTRRARHHDRCVRASELDAVPPCRRMTRQHRLRWEDQRCRLTAKAVVDPDARDHVDAMQYASKLRAQQPTTTDETFGQGIASTKGLLAKGPGNSGGCHREQGAATAVAPAELVHKPRARTIGTSCAQVRGTAQHRHVVRITCQKVADGRDVMRTTCQKAADRRDVMRTTCPSGLRGR